MNPSAQFVAGALLTLTTVACPSSPSQISAGCPDPAPLLGEKTEAPGYIVVFHEGTPAAVTVEQLARKYGFSPRHVYEHALPGFSAELTDAVLEGIRCEPVVRHVEFDQEITVR